MAGNFGWEYPPGVSGNELELAGPSWEGEVTRTCTQTDVTLFALSNDGKRPLPKGPISLNDLIEIIVPECPCIDMEVEAWAFENTLHWTCPVCGHEYNEYGRDD